MQRWKRVVGGGVSSISGVKRRFSGTTPGLRILMYHSIKEHAPGDSKDLYCLSPIRFRSHLDFLHDRQADPAFAVHPLAELQAVGISFTFDDGYLDNLEVAAPLLFEYGFSSHVFVNPSFLMSGERHYLTQQSLRELANVSGVTIGAHGYSHRLLTDCTPSELEFELDASKKWIEDTISREVTTMAYPHGAMNSEVRLAAAKAGYKFAVSSKYGIVTSVSDRFALERTEIWSTDMESTFRSKLIGNWDWMGKRT
ncbi:MAG: polysaccharide deacetylase family protein [Ilumatobacteraceae bacterium]